jgi:hypothetical protein
MKEVDYAKLSEQYGGFLVAAGGVSITVLAVILSLTRGLTSSEQAVGLCLQPCVPNEKVEAARLFLVAALIVGTVSCFAGAHMMAETAAFFTQLKERLPRKRPRHKILLGQRLFVLATAHVFISIGLILFAIVLLPTVTGLGRLVAGMKLISAVVLIGVLLAALVWMVLATIDRTSTVQRDWYVIAIGLVIGLGAGFGSRLGTSNFGYLESLASQMFIIIVSVTAISLVYFAVIFKFGMILPGRLRRNIEVAAFSSAIAFAYMSLVVAYFKILY